ncbi:transmembrane sensor [Pedobacter africanus]|uniref:Ferric-dicitrate binding protein FerR (Iron transport regulator) n=1 Tax=Pedobacter africanus TaxID=151894 RepID=A0ACC6KSF4_9SPHI|nr:FecR family protein [Pedobacter africanus]MDR6782120.1 ferric-dicitrate binding protein FerR (iron transport regulator) [Pedobacter africanus]
MIDRSLFNIEDFLVDNTFQLYCAGKDKLCIAYWEDYIKAHPEQEATINEAKRLYIILSGQKKPLNQQLDLLKNDVKPEVEENTVPLRRTYTWLKIAAVLLFVSGLVLVYRANLVQEKFIPNLVTNYHTNGAERKKITLPDGTVILLNAKSSIRLNKKFNIDNREVTLVGEAYFDVTHDKNRPFKVLTSDFNINVLGTIFNVKAYPDEPTSEAVLIKGVIVMEGAGSNGNSITLKPSQKVTFYKNLPEPPAIKPMKAQVKHPEITINSYTKKSDSTVVEMAWTQNRLEIQDQSFMELKKTLERWYNVEITFKNKEIEKYQFTATFQDESLTEVLYALQCAEFFKYEIKGNQVIISK